MHLFCFHERKINFMYKTSGYLYFNKLFINFNNINEYGKQAFFNKA